MLGSAIYFCVAIDVPAVAKLWSQKLDSDDGEIDTQQSIEREPVSTRADVDC